MPEVWPICLLIAGLAIEAGMLRLGIDDLDEGYFIQQATRVVHGQVPFRDFATLYSPGLVYLHAAVFGVFGGPSLVTARVVSLLARAGLMFGVYALTRPFVRSAWWAAAPGLVLLLGLDDAPVRWEPHPGWLSSLFAVLVAWCLIHRSATAWYVAGAGLAALAYAFKQNTGVFILLPVLAWAGWRRLWLPMVTFLAVSCVWLVPLALAVGEPGHLTPLVGGVNGASLFAPPDPPLLIPVAALLGGLWCLRQDSDSRLRWLLIAGVALFLTEFPRMDTPHLAWSAPVLLAVGAIVLSRQRGWVAIISLASAGALLAPTLVERVESVRQPFAAVDGVQAPAQTALDIQGAVGDIRARTAPGEPIFVYPTSPLLYVLSERPNPTRFDHLNPGAASPAQIQQVIGALASERVQVVVISDFWESVWGAPGDNAVLETWIDAHYHEVARHGAYRVLVAGL